MSFYASVRSINVLVLLRSGSLPLPHGERHRFIRESNDLCSLVCDYADSRDWSEQARYTLSHTHFDSTRAEFALEIARRIHHHVAALLESA
jgi:hypothetical protein